MESLPNYFAKKKEPAALPSLKKEKNSDLLGRLATIVQTVSGKRNLHVTTRVDALTRSQAVMGGQNPDKEWFMFRQYDRQSGKVQEYVHIPVKIVESHEDHAKGKAAHEGGHVAVTRYQDFIPDKVMEELGFGVIMAGAEERPTDMVVKERFAGAGDWLESARKVELVGQKESGAIERIGQIPKFIQLKDLLVYAPYFEEPPVGYSKDVLEVYEKIRAAMEKMERILPREGASEYEITEKAKERYRIVYKKIWKEAKKLIDKDLEQESLRQMIKKDRGQGGEMLKKLEEDIRKKLEEIIEQAKRDRQQKEDEKDKKDSESQKNGDGEKKERKQDGEERQDGEKGKDDEQQKENQEKKEGNGDRQEEGGQKSEKEEREENQEDDNDGQEGGRGEEGRGSSEQEGEGQGDKEGDSNEKKGRVDDQQQKENQSNKKEEEHEQQADVQEDAGAGQQGKEGGKMIDDGQKKSGQMLEDGTQTEQQQLDNSEDGTRIPMDNLDSKVLEALKRVFDSLSKEQKDELKKIAEENLKKIEDEAIKEMRGSLDKDQPETHEERQKRQGKEEQEKSDREFMKKISQEMENIDRKQAVLQENKKEYDSYYETIRNIDEPLYQELEEIFHPNIKHGVRLNSTGSNINLAAVFRWDAEKSVGLQAINNQIFEQVHIPEKKDYVFTILVDLSGSMQGERIEETFRTVVLLAEVLNRLGVKNEILGFQDEIISFKEFDQDLIEEVRRKITGMLAEAYNSNPNGHNRSRYNDDGPCLMEASESLSRQSGKEKFLLVLSDGVPEGRRSTEEDLHRVIASILGESDQKLVGIGLGEEARHVKNFYPTSLPGVKIEELAEKIGDLLKDMIENPSAYNYKKEV